MNCFYRMRRAWLAILCGFLLCWGVSLPLYAETVPILPQFVAYNSPRDFPALEFQDAKGTWRSLEDYRGQLVLVNLWATWCAPCRKELPQLDNLQAVYASTGFLVLPLSIDSPQTAPKILNFYREQNLRNLPILHDPTGMTMRLLRPRGLPSSYLIGRDGRALGEIIGYARWDSPEAANLVEAYLQRR
jgi:thiol-disulfide isomerase/thioredoxin